MPNKIDIKELIGKKVVDITIKTDKWTGNPSYIMIEFGKGRTLEIAADSSCLDHVYGHGEVAQALFIETRDDFYG